LLGRRFAKVNLVMDKPFAQSILPVQSPSIPLRRGQLEGFMRDVEGVAPRTASEVDETVVASSPVQLRPATQADEVTCLRAEVRRLRETRCSLLRANAELRAAVDELTVKNTTLESLRQLEERLAALIGHELRTPLSGLRSYAELFVSYFHDDLASDEARAAARRIHSLAERLGLMIDDLFEMARISSGKLRIAHETIDLRAVVTAAIEIAETLPDAPPIQLHAVDDCLIPGDARRLSGVILSLLTNAIHHGSGTERIDVRIRWDSEGAAIDVEDYGRGIPPSELPLIFNKHYQVHHEAGAASTGRAGGGLGLGLYIAQHVVSAHGGRIEVASTLGVGTRFTIHLPRD
jgi:two-component system sensor histidine kinase ResE